MEKNFDDIIDSVFKRAEELSFDTDEAIQGLKNLLKFDSKYFSCQEDQLAKFCNCFINRLQHMLVVHKYQTQYLINFVGQFLSQLEDQNEFLVQNEILSFLIRNNKANSDIVRCHIYELIEKFLFFTRTSLPSSRHEIDERLFVRLQQCVVEGMRDCCLGAQQAAIRAAYALQVPHERHCKVIEAYLNLLEHASVSEVRALVLEHIVVNNATLEFMRTKLLFDSDPVVRERLVTAIVLKKVPNEFVLSRFRRNLLECVLDRDRNRELAEALLFKWLDLSSKKCDNPIFRFISSLEIEKEWFPDFDSKIVSYNDSNLLQIMEIVYDIILSESNDLNALLLALEQHVTVEKFLTDLNTAFYYRSLVVFVVHKLKFRDLIDKEFPTLLLKNVLDERKDVSPLILYNLIELVFCLADSTARENMSMLFKLIRTIPTVDAEFVYDSVLSKYTPRLQLMFFWRYYSKYAHRLVDDVGILKKVLVLFACVMAHLSADDVDRVDDWIAEIDPDFYANSDHSDDGEEPMLLDYLFKNILLSNLSNLDPQVRALVARGLGLVSATNISVWDLFVDIFIKMIINDYPQVVVEAQKALFNIIIYYSHQVNTSDQNMMKLWTNMLETLENQFDCLDENIFYVTCEGFGKLLVNGCRLESNEKIITSLLIAYVTTTQNEATMTTYTKRKLLSCLNSFFHLFKSLNAKSRAQLMRSFLPTLKFLLAKQTSLIALKRLAKFFNYLANETTNVRQFLMQQLLNEIFVHLDDFYHVQKLIDILLELRVHQSDIDANSMENLVSIHFHLQLMIAKFKQEKWKLAKEDELKELANSVKKLIMANDETKRALKRINPSLMSCDLRTKISKR